MLEEESDELELWNSNSLLDVGNWKVTVLVFFSFSSPLADDDLNTLLLRFGFIAGAEDSEFGDLNVLLELLLDLVSKWTCLPLTTLSFSDGDFLLISSDPSPLSTIIPSPFSSDLSSLFTNISSL